MALETLNDAAVSWAECKAVANIDGGIDLPDIDWKSFDFEEKVERSWQRSQGGRPKKKTTGQTTPAAKAQAYREGIKALKRGLMAVAPENAAGQKQLSKVRFTLVITHSYEGDPDIYCIEIRDCTLDSNIFKLAEGNEADVVDIDLNPREVVEIIDGQEVVLL